MGLPPKEIGRRSCGVDHPRVRDGNDKRTLFLSDTPARSAVSQRREPEATAATDVVSAAIDQADQGRAPPIPPRYRPIKKWIARS
jgi:hypothetical protein